MEKVSKKIWNFDFESENYIGDVKRILDEYKDGLNSQQDILIANIDIGINCDGEAVFTFNVNDKLYVNKNTIFTLAVKHNGTIDITTHYFRDEEVNRGIPILKLDEILDEKVKSERLGSVIAYYISIIKRRELN